MLAAGLLFLGVHVACFGAGVWLVRRAGRMDARHSLCRRCGYDTSASRERCPECGLHHPAYDLNELECSALNSHAWAGLCFGLPILLDLAVVAAVFGPF